nr:alpha-mannosidase 2C1-like [Cherax quadricarinatus]
MSDPGVQASIHKDVNTTLPRVYNYYTATRFRQVNLIDRLYPDTRSVELSHWAVPGGEGAWQEWSFEDVVQQNFEPTSLGEQFGPTWSTHWFKVNFQVPDEWAGSEVRLRWGSNSEAAVWSPDGSILQGLSTGDTGSLRTDFTITNSYEAGSPPYTLYIEMAANRLLGASPGDLIDPPDPEMRFTLSRAEISQLDSRIYKLTRDLEVLYQLAEQLMPDQRGYQALYTANQMVNSITAGDDSVASDLADLLGGVKKEEPQQCTLYPDSAFSEPLIRIRVNNLNEFMIETQNLLNSRISGIMLTLQDFEKAINDMSMHSAQDNCPKLLELHGHQKLQETPVTRLVYSMERKHGHRGHPIVTKNNGHSRTPQRWQLSSYKELQLSAALGDSNGEVGLRPGDRKGEERFCPVVGN